MDEQNYTFPRPLTDKEWVLVEWILPENRSGYNKYRSLLKTLQVIGYGRWGESDLILGEPGDKPDISGPMERVFANGIIEADEGKITVAVHEYVAGQLELQITNLHDESVPDDLTIKRKTTYSVWKPKAPCPFCNKEVREVMINNEDPRAILVICSNDENLWVYDEKDGVNHPIPATNYYNELMLHKQIKDSSIALQSKNLFRMLDDHTDDDLCQAFVKYNKTWRRITIQPGSASNKKKQEKLTERLIPFVKRKKSE